MDTHEARADLAMLRQSTGRIGEGRRQQFIQRLFDIVESEDSSSSIRRTATNALASLMKSEDLAAVEYAKAMSRPAPPEQHVHIYGAQRSAPTPQEVIQEAMRHPDYVRYLTGVDS